VRRVDRIAGIGLALLALTVLWSARSFPDVPGQDLGAATLPTLIGVALLACGLLLVRRSLDPRRYPRADAAASPTVDGPPEADPVPVAGNDGGRLRIGPPLAMLGAVLLYLLLSEPLGYLLVAPASVLIALLALGVRALPALGWALGASALVHLAFYKLLKVPLPWGLVRPFY